MQRKKERKGQQYMSAQGRKATNITINQREFDVNVKLPEPICSCITRHRIIYSWLENEGDDTIEWAVEKKRGGRRQLARASERKMKQRAVERDRGMIVGVDQRKWPIVRVICHTAYTNLWDFKSYRAKSRLYHG